jgi:hypothetical protein
MLDNPRQLEVTDPFGRKWSAEMRWLQNAITIRHADAVDVKWELTADDGTTMDKVIALRHPDLLEVSKKLGRQLSDPWCIRLAVAHLRRVVETWEDADKIIATPSREQMEEYGQKIEQAASATR